MNKGWLLTWGTLGIVASIWLLLNPRGYAAADARLATTLPCNTAWWLVNGDGFGNPLNRSIFALEEFKGYLYAGTSNAAGAEIWRSADGLTWGNVITTSDGHYHMGHHIMDFVVFNDYLYASTHTVGVGGSIWRSSNGVDWTRVLTGDSFLAETYAFPWMQVFRNKVYLLALGWGGTNTTELWTTPDGLSWQPTRDIPDFSAMTVFQDSLYVGTRNEITGAGLWRTDGLTWTMVMTDGFGNVQNIAIEALRAFDNRLYVTMYNNSTGMEIWSAADGLNWTVELTGSIGNAQNGRRVTLIGFDGYLHLFTYADGGGQVWRSREGRHWEQVGCDGWGDARNVGPNLEHSVAIFQGQMFVGPVRRTTTDSQLLLFLHHSFYLPCVIKKP